MVAETERAARTLMLDLATGEVVRALDTARIDCVVLKGPATVHRLYGEAPGIRNYTDIDLAVDPDEFAAAGRVLAGLGFEDRDVGIRASEAARRQEACWHRPGARPVTVDLHRGFHHVTDGAAWWEMLTRHRAALMLEGQAVTVPDPAACALIIGLHASNASPERKTLEDLRRALVHFDDDVWRQAADLAGSLGATDALAAALGRLDTGVARAGRLGLAATNPGAWFAVTSPRRGAAALSVVLQPGTWGGRARQVRDTAFPSRVLLARSRPMAAHGAGGLVLAHLGRLPLVAARLPPLLLAWRRATREERGPGATHPGPEWRR